MQYGMSQFPHPTNLGQTPADSPTPRADTSQVNLSFLFKLEFKILTMRLSVLLQGSETGQAPVVPLGGPPGAGQPSTWPPPATGPGFWPPMPWGPPPGGQGYMAPLPQGGPRYWPSPMSWPTAPGGQVMPWGMPPWVTQQRPLSPATV